ncbi:MAG: hypothetical protein GY758_04620 [Fuerstiella sp.]|nr:hypothetical protein [Fuerstiella sp.]MCP4783873.1 hypothetical protein [Fuerstiella sp.]MCP4857465.1 hypothetical protein [Fuerstiella sp.]
MQNSTPAPTKQQSVANVIVTQNPFYLISAAFVIHGTSFWFKANGSHHPWALMGLVGAFIVVLTFTGVAIVRIGKMWDDARSIFVMLLLLFVELALSFDDTLILSPREGAGLICCGFLFAVAVCEFMFASLRIRLGIRLRIPLHLMVGLLFLYPLTMVPAITNSWQSAIQWQLFGFNLCIATSVLLLVVAANRGASYCEMNGTPWNWPVFPWAALAVLVTGLEIRAYAMCISLDPAMSQSMSDARQLQSIFPVIS